MHFYISVSILNNFLAKELGKAVIINKKATNWLRHLLEFSNIFSLNRQHFLVRCGGYPLLGLRWLDVGCGLRCLELVFLEGVGTQKCAFLSKGGTRFTCAKRAEIEAVKLVTLGFLLL